MNNEDRGNSHAITENGIPTVLRRENATCTNENGIETKN